MGKPGLIGELRDTRQLCKAQKKRGAGPCSSYAMPNGYCRVHGGASLAGPAHPGYVHGRRSRYAHRLSADQQDDFADALAAPDPLDLRDEIALIRTQIVDQVVSGPDLYSLRRILREAEKTLEAVLLEGSSLRFDDTVPSSSAPVGDDEDWDEEAEKTSEQEMGEQLEKVLLLIREGYDILTGQQVRTTDTKTVQGLMNTLKGLVDTSGRIMDIRANSFTRIQSVAFVSRIVELIGSNVKDPADRKRLLTALTQLASEIAPAHQAPSIGAKVE